MDRKELLSKVEEGISVIVFSNTTDSKDDIKKTKLPNVVTDDGIVTDTNRVPLKALEPIDVTVEGITIDDNCESEKASTGIAAMDAAIFTAVT